MYIKRVLFAILMFGSFYVFPQQEITIKNEFLKVNISTLGAELQNIIGLVSGKEYLWQGNPEYWPDRSPVMFPVCVRFIDNTFEYKGTQYDMPYMGLAKTSSFNIVEHQIDKLVLELKSNVSILKHYPFPFRLEITYKLEKNKLVNRFLIENLGKDTMYFGVGGHPIFRLPDSERKDFQYTFSEKMTRERPNIDDSIIQPEDIPFLEDENHLELTDIRIPGGGMFFKHMPAKEIGIGLIEEKPIITVDLGNFPNVNLWSPPNYPFACIEPMVGHHDIKDSPLAIDKKGYLTRLKASESKTYHFSVSIND
tara:strand:+ start:74 stop:1000 length:927 start_codon:yes stop_codon:yes gene_type:complete